MRRTGGILTVSILAVVIIAGYFFLFRQKNTAKQQVYQGPINKMRVGNIGEYSIFDLIAKDRGFFKENGLDVTINTYESGPPAVADLLAGNVDVAVAADFVGVRNIFTDSDLRILTQASRHRVFHMIARIDHGIRAPSDLKGKTIGVTKKGVGEFYLSRYLLYNNLSQNEVTIVDLTPTQMISRLETGKIDAIVIFDPHAYNLIKKLGSSVVHWSVQNNQDTFALAYSTNSFIQTHRDIIERYIRALLEASQWLKEHPQEAKADITRILHYEPAYIEYIWSNFNFNHGLDQALILTMEDQARFAIERGLTDKKQVPNYLNYIYFDALEKINPEAVTIIH